MRKNEPSPAASRTTPRRGWAPPRLRRLKTSAAELGLAGTIDSEGLS